MSEPRSRSRVTAPRRLPRGRHALSPEEVLSAQRERLLAAVPAVIAERGYEAASVADIVKRAAVSRNAFYKNFNDKQDCVAQAQEARHQQLFEVLTAPCEEGASLEERVDASLEAGLETLAAEPEVARLLFVEAPAAGEEIALRYHDWLARYGTLLRAAAPDLSPEMRPAPEVERVIVGGIASRIASELLQGGKGSALRDLKAPFVEYVLAFYRLSEPGPKAGEVVAFEPEPDSASEAYEARRRQASA
jgi:AcrR family transcriptional regulator